MEKLIALGVLGLLAFRAKKKIEAVYEFKYSPAGFPKVLFEGGSVVISLPIRVSNVTNESFQINGFSGRVFMSGQFISDFAVNESVSLGEYGSAVFSIQFTVPLLGAVITLVKAITEGLGNQVIQVRGTAKVRAVYIPVIFDYAL